MASARVSAGRKARLRVQTLDPLGGGVHQSVLNELQPFIDVFVSRGLSNRGSSRSSGSSKARVSCSIPYLPMVETVMNPSTVS